MPFVFTEDQIRVLLRAALALPPSRGNPQRGRTFFTLILVLYATGMRISEAVRLRVSDIDFAAGTLLISESKFFKTRLVPVAKDVLERLRVHVRKLPKGFDQPVFQTSGRRYTLNYAKEIGCRLLRICGFKPADGHRGPRVHDLRRTFAVHRIERWYAEGAEVQSLLPALATYMGHKDIVSTQHYATVTAAIRDHAGRRFERACAPSAEG
jgi:integrase